MAASARIESSKVRGTLYLALELSRDTWELGFTIGLGQRPRRRAMPAADLERLEAEIARAKRRFGLHPEARVVSCYEAGRDGFWLHRFLRSAGIENHVVDSSSIQVHRRRKQAKTDGLDVDKLLNMLVRHDQGEPKVWSVVRVPGVEEEDNRHLHRELIALKRERTRLRNRVKGLSAQLRGHYSYFGITPNYRALVEVYLQVLRLWRKWLNRKSQRPSMPGWKFDLLLSRYPLPRPRVVHSAVRA